MGENMSNYVETIDELPGLGTSEYTETISKLPGLGTKVLFVLRWSGTIMEGTFDGDKFIENTGTLRAFDPYLDVVRWKYI